MFILFSPARRRTRSALAQLCNSFHSVICHERSHIQTDECGAPEFFTGGSKLFWSAAPMASSTLVRSKRCSPPQIELHSHKPGAISISQATEFGTVYRRDEIAAIADLARQAHKLFLHMDGARFANAIASLDCAPKAITWEAGVDVLCFGGTKNGVAAGELVIFFDKTASREFDYRVKQAGQLGSKMRFLAAPWLGLLTEMSGCETRGTLMRRRARLRSACNARQGLRQHFQSRRMRFLYPMEERLTAGLHARGWRFYRFVEPDVYRLMCSWATTERDISDFVGDVSYKSLNE